MIVRRLAVLLLLVTSCRANNRPAAVPVVEPPPVRPVESPWPGVFTSVRQAVDSGRYADAERILAEFSVAHAGTVEATESDFWRAVLKADPANRDATTKEGIAALDAYLAGGETMPRFVEARLLRRTLVALDSLRLASSVARAAAEARDKLRDEEMTKLTDSLTATKTELDRIRRRLTSPRP